MATPVLPNRLYRMIYLSHGCPSDTNSTFAGNAGALLLPAHPK